jgi:hypothetical protein
LAESLEQAAIDDGFSSAEFDIEGENLSVGVKRRSA